jgi:hypothetical protein
MAQRQRQRKGCTALGRRGERSTVARPLWKGLLIHVQIEYLVVCYDQDNRKVRLSLRQADILAALANDEKLLQQGGGVPDLQTGDAE